MSKGTNQKLKLYRLGQIMVQETDDEHGLTIQEIKDKLFEYGITADRKSLYEDLETLEILGITVEKRQDGRKFHYHVVEKRFEMAELKLLVDAIQASRFITEKKSGALIKKLTSFVSRYEMQQLDRQVYVSGRIKTMNESIYYNVDAIHKAISDDCRISFEYLTWNLKKELVPRRKGRYEVSPLGLTWTDENYYLIAYDSQAEIIKHYRVDKMRRIRSIDQRWDGYEYFDRFDLVEYTNRNFSMYGGKAENVRLRFENEMVSVLIDRFGKDIQIYPVDEYYSDTIVTVAVSEQFFGWVFGLGGRVWIENPEGVVKQYQSVLLKQSEIMGCS